MAAAHRGRKECVELLISKEADATAENTYKETADTLVEQRMKQIKDETFKKCMQVRELLTFNAIQAFECLAVSLALPYTVRRC